MLGRFPGLLASCTLAFAWGCGSDTGGNQAVGAGASAAGSGNGIDAGGSNAGNGSAGTSSAQAGANTAAGTTGNGEFPCEVQALLATKCQACHKLEPPGALLSPSDFTRPSKVDPQKSIGQVAVERVQSTTSVRMPPAPLEAATPAEIAALANWVQGGAKPTACGDAPVPTAPDPYDTPVVCTSGKTWTGGNRESPLMRPGGACIACHSQEGDGPIFALSGTVFPTPHEPDDCNGVNSAAGAKVVVTEANGTAHTLEVNAAGNFFLEVPSFKYPYQAKIVYQGRERVMVEAQMSGDCNACHTEAGSQKAPGRIFLP
jgi:mono/diheme cytochrome c family protein